MPQKYYVVKDRKFIATWLVLCLLLVAFMVAVGGYTRLSGSGLSITEWKPIHGIIPPMGVHEWEEEFENYLQSPQGQTTNAGISFEEFQAIFWPEYWHRVLGRVIGMVFLLPLLFFALRKSITKRFGWRLAGIFALGGLQGLMGWLMVASGLVDDPHVSHIRLAIHLFLAFTLFAMLIWALLDVLYKNQPKKPNIQALKGYKLWFGLLCAQIIFGALVAGLKAGLIYNTWPTMNGMWLPPELLNDPKPWVDNVALIQFLHRKLAILVAVGFGLWWYFSRNHAISGRAKLLQLVVALLIAMQFALGVFTLLYQVPLNLALIHQMGGLVLLGAAVVLYYQLRLGRAEQND